MEELTTMTAPSRQAEQWLDRTRKAYAAHSGVPEPEDDLALWAWLAAMNAWAEQHDPIGYALFAPQFRSTGIDLMADAATEAGVDLQAVHDFVDDLISRTETDR